MDHNYFMIIDDDEDDRFFFKDALTKMPSAVKFIEANGGQEALELLRTGEHMPHYIFLDINMPRIDGRECLKLLKSDAKLKHIPVIMYSTSFSQESITEFHKLGASTCLKKPTDVTKLPAQIIEVIKDL
ncbi:response regulator [Subsaximicrobium wynnwilliamsii]|uniref:Response regulator n=1 Tax=Subsaximicrobium wynnwilliamsii TaxID=291179 RepID=A0A5C6ZN45_9FLAO|nr:response regulator [Subsaximicrobium wynnwilliamsii]TXD85226.1 response regulator [Subsaximicrobium wynnwilliamsii]TXD91269.1 response regulator [Subsaximicrobium wynnwilliamsii]TXE04662.1 response regulator [Subsaximicrobium wynnwilliamsii]